MRKITGLIATTITVLGLMLSGTFAVPAQADHGELPNGEPVSNYTGLLPDGSAIPNDCILPDGTADPSCAAWTAHRLEHCMDKVDSLRATSKASVVVDHDTAALDQSAALALAERRTSDAIARAEAAEKQVTQLQVANAHLDKVADRRQATIKRLRARLARR